MCGSLKSNLKHIKLSDDYMNLFINIIIFMLFNLNYLCGHS